MNAPYDWNELDKAIYALGRSTSGLPDAFRCLTEGNLCALVPHSLAEEVQDFKIQNGSPFHFVMLKEGEGEAVAIFSSEARAEEGMKAAGVPENTYAVATMRAKEMLEVLGAMNMRALLNKSCATGGFVLPPDLMRDLANGRALSGNPISPGQPEEQTFNIIDPADYPTDLIQPLFETLRRHREFRAAWVARKPEPTVAGGTHYQLLLLMDPRSEGLAHDFNLVLQNSCKKSDETSLGFVDENDQAYIASLLEQARPFFTAPDFGAGNSVLDNG
jgi:hypothetical protein